MREIKFRAWNADKSIMVYKNEDGGSDYWDGIQSNSVDLINHYLNNNKSISGDKYIYMQFTGLKDKNGKEIYEGDIIRLVDNDNGYLEVIFVNAYNGGWVLKHKNIDRWLSLGARKPQDVEVIGNIYENPELLK